MNALLTRSLTRLKDELSATHARSKLVQQSTEALAKLGDTPNGQNAAPYYPVLKMACESQHGGATIVALDCLQKLLAHGFLRGDERITRQVASSSSSSSSSSEAVVAPTKTKEEVPLIDEVVETVCRCNNLTDDGVQLQVIKALLTAITTEHATVNEESLLLAVRSCYNIHLVSHSVVNKTTAKATLTQMLSFMFQRMETAEVEILHTQERKQQAAYSKLNRAFADKVTKEEEEEEQEEEEESAIGSEAAAATTTTTAAAAATKTPTTATSSSGSGMWPTQHHKNAWLLFRSLCKLSMKDGRSTAVDGGSFVNGGGGGVSGLAADVASSSTDPVAIQSKVLCLELLLSVLRSSGPAFRNSTKFLSAIRQYLCISLLRNCTSNVQEVVDISLQVFVQLIDHFKDHLKAEIEVFVTKIFLRILDSENSSFHHKGMVLEVLHKLCQDPVALVEIFVNYDADLESVDLFRQIVDALARCAKGGLNAGSSRADYDGVGLVSGFSSGSSRRSQAQERKIRQMGLRGLQAILVSLVLCGQNKAPPETPEAAVVSSSSSSPASSELAANGGDGAALADAADGSPLPLPPPWLAGGGGDNSSALSTSGSGGFLSPIPAVSPNEVQHLQQLNLFQKQFSSPIGKDAVEVFDRKQKLKEERERGILQFNLKPSKGLKYLEERGHFKHEPRAVATFLFQFRDALDKTVIGDYLGKEKEYQEGFCVRVLHEYIDMMDFGDMLFDEAIRHFLSGFRLPGEAQKIDRMMEKFAERYCIQNPNSVFPSADTAFVLAFSIIMLNTDAHNPAITSDRKMTQAGFRRQVEGIANGGNLPDDFLDGIYWRITAKAISLKDDDARREKKSAKSGGIGGLGGGGGSDIAEALSVFGATPVEKRRRTAFATEREEMVKAGETLFQGTRRSKQLQKERKEEQVKGGSNSGGGEGGGSSGGSGSGSSGSSSPSELASFHRLSSEDVQDLYVRPMFAVAWGPIVGALSHTLEAVSGGIGIGGGFEKKSHSSGLLEKSEAEATVDVGEVVSIGLATMLDAIHLAASLGMMTARATLVSGLAKFTTLDGVREMKPLHVECVKALLRVAVDDGQYLGESWEPVLQCVSRLNRLQLTASGAAGDDIFFTDDSGKGSGAGTVGVGHSNGGGGSHGPEAVFGKMFGGSSSSGSSQQQQQQQQHLELASTLERSNAHQLLAAVDSLALKIDHIFEASVHLNSTAIQHFVTQLSAVAALELFGGGTKSLRGWEVIGSTDTNGGYSSLPQSGSGGDDNDNDSSNNGNFVAANRVTDPTVSTPRVFSLQKLVEVADFNMDIRPRVIWSSVWGVLSKHFTAAGLHPNPKVAIYSIDSLRQLSVKFLSKDELRDFNFQRVFLKPFESIMRDSRNKDIQELVVLSVDSLVQTRLQQLKSGWKTMLTVLSLGAATRHPDIVQLAFKSVKRLAVRDFDLLVFDFTEIVNALLAFAALDDTRVALEAIALIKNCATKLGDGRVGAVMARLQGDRPGEKPTLNGASEAIDDNQWQLWWPLLYGLSQSVGDRRVEVRRSALGALGGTLVEFGSGFSEETWRLVFKGIIFPVMESAWTDGTPYAQLASSYPAQPMPIDEESEDAAASFILTTAKQVFQVCIDLFRSFPAVAETLLHETLSLLTESICQEIETLARGATAALHQLVLSMPAGASPALWDMLCEALSAVTCRPLPPALVGPHMAVEGTIEGGEEVGGGVNDGRGGGGVGDGAGSPSGSPLASPQTVSDGRGMDTQAGGRIADTEGTEVIGVENQLLRRGILTQLVVTLLMQDVLQAALEAHYLDLKATHLRTLMDALLSTATTARQFHAEVDLRKGLRAGKLMYFPHRSGALQLPHLVEQETKAYVVLLDALSRLLATAGRQQQQEEAWRLRAAGGHEQQVPPPLLHTPQQQQQHGLLGFDVAAARVASGGTASPLYTAGLSSFSPTYFVNAWRSRVRKYGFVYEFLSSLSSNFSSSPSSSSSSSCSTPSSSSSSSLPVQQRVYAHKLSALEAAEWFPDGKNFLATDNSGGGGGGSGRSGDSSLSSGSSGRDGDSLVEVATSVGTGDLLVVSWPDGKDLRIARADKFHERFSPVACAAAASDLVAASSIPAVGKFMTFVSARLTYTFQVVLDEYALKDGRASHALARANVDNAYGYPGGDAVALEEEATKMVGIVVQVLRCLVQSEDEYLGANMNWLMGSLCELVRCRDEKVRLALHKVMVQKISPLLTG